MDYAALAKQYGGTTDAPAIDYAALAKQYGGTTTVNETPATRSLVSQIPTERGANLTPTPQAPVSLIDKIYGAAEVFPAMAGGMVGGVVTPIAQLGYELFGGQAFTPQGRAAAAEFGKKYKVSFINPELNRDKNTPPPLAML
jgi:hypothetical protein